MEESKKEQKSSNQASSKHEDQKPSGNEPSNQQGPPEADPNTLTTFEKEAKKSDQKKDNTNKS